MARTMPCGAEENKEMAITNALRANQEVPSNDNLSDLTDRLLAAAPTFARLLVRLEEDSYAGARPRPFCGAIDADATEGLPHTVECELDRVLFESGARAL